VGCVKWCAQTLRYAGIVLSILGIIGQIMIEEGTLMHNCAVPTEPY